MILSPLVRLVLTCSPSSWSASLVKNDLPDLDHRFISSVASSFVISSSLGLAKSVEVFVKTESGLCFKRKGRDLTASIVVVVEISLEEISIWVGGQESPEDPAPYLYTSENTVRKPMS